MESSGIPAPQAMESPGIARIIHHMWLDRKMWDNKGPPASRKDYGEYCDRLQRMNVGFEYRFWNRKMVSELWDDPMLAPWKDFYKTLRHHIETCDVSRYAIMFVHGGLYMDLDFIPQKDFADLLYHPDPHERDLCFPDTPLPPPRPRRIGLVWEPTEHAHMYGERPFISNSFLASEPGHPFWSGLLDFIMARYHGRFNVVKSTGPWMIGEYYRSLLQTRNSHLIQALEQEYGALETYFLNTCLFYPVTAAHGNPVTAGCPPNAREEAIAYTEYVKGSGWAYTVANTASVEAAWIVLMAFFLAFVIGALFLSLRTRA